MRWSRPSVTYRASKALPTSPKAGRPIRPTLVVIDPATDTVVDRYRVDGCRGNHGMAIDAERHRAFLSCEGNDTLTVFDLDTHQAIAHFPMAKGADVVMFDRGLGRVDVACSSGAISVFQMDGPAHFRKLQDVPVEPKIHSLAVDPRTHRVYARASGPAARTPSRLPAWFSTMASRRTWSWSANFVSR